MDEMTLFSQELEKTDNMDDAVKMCEAEIIKGLQASASGDPVDEDSMYEAGSYLLVLSYVKAGIEPEVIIDQLEKRDYDLKFTISPEEGLLVSADFTDDTGVITLEVQDGS